MDGWEWTGAWYDWTNTMAVVKLLATPPRNYAPPIFPPEISGGREFHRIACLKTGRQIFALKFVRKKNFFFAPQIFPPRNFGGARFRVEERGGVISGGSFEDLGLPADILVASQLTFEWPPS